MNIKSQKLLSLLLSLMLVIGAVTLCPASAFALSQADLFDSVEEGYDTERENGNPEKAEKMKKSCEENGWTAISMKNDRKTIYGDGVTRK